MGNKKSTYLKKVKKRLDMYTILCVYLGVNQYGRIINISSVVASSGNIGQTNYSASKAGIIGFTKSLSRELASRNITVNCISPGYISTDMTNAISDSVKDDIISKTLIK